MTCQLTKHVIEDHLKKLESLGVKGVQASLDDSDKIEQAVYEHDIVINGASSDHPGSVDATLKAIERRSKEVKKTIYIHTSGTGVLDDNANGEEREATIFTDEKPDQVEALSDRAPHRAIDKKISRAAEKLKETASIRILLPPLVCLVLVFFVSLQIHVPTDLWQGCVSVVAFAYVHLTSHRFWSIQPSALTQLSLTFFELSPRTALHSDADTASRQSQVRLRRHGGLRRSSLVERSRPRSRPRLHLPP